MDEYKCLGILITGDYVLLQGSKNGKRFSSRRLWTRGADVVAHARRMWETTGLWPVVKITCYLDTKCPKLLPHVISILAEYRKSKHHDITLERMSKK